MNTFGHVCVWQPKTAFIHKEQTAKKWVLCVCAKRSQNVGEKPQNDECLMPIQMHAGPMWYVLHENKSKRFCFLHFSVYFLRIFHFMLFEVHTKGTELLLIIIICLLCLCVRVGWWVLAPHEINGVHANATSDISARQWERHIIIMIHCANFLYYIATPVCRRVECGAVLPLCPCSWFRKCWRNEIIMKRKKAGDSIQFYFIILFCSRPCCWHRYWRAHCCCTNSVSFRQGAEA